MMNRLAYYSLSFVAGIMSVLFLFLVGYFMKQIVGSTAILKPVFLIVNYPVGLIVEWDRNHSQWMWKQPIPTMAVYLLYWGLLGIFVGLMLRLFRRNDLQSDPSKHASA